MDFRRRAEFSRHRLWHGCFFFAAFWPGQPAAEFLVGRDGLLYVSRTLSRLVDTFMESFSALGFFADGYMGHTSYVLLILSSLMRRMFWLRAFFIASALTGIS
jgi:hypothetical protein